MATIQERLYKDGTIKFRAMVRRRGFPPLSQTFDRKTDAKRWAQDQEVKIDDGRMGGFAESRKRTVNDLVERYIREVLPRKREKMCKQQTLQLNWWKAELGALRLMHLTPSCIARCRDKLASTVTVRGKMTANATVNKYIAALSHALNTAVREWEWLGDSPVRKVTKLRLPRGRLRYLTDDERERLFASCQASTNSYLYLVVLIAISTGMRQSEIMGLTWSRVDLLRGRAVLSDTKNGERRAVPITGLALQRLNEHYAKRLSDTDLVFPSKVEKHRSFKSMEMRQPWEKAVFDAKLEDFRFHDLRHTAASYLAMNGASLADIAEVLGHKTIQMTRRYAHLSESHTHAVVEKMNRQMFGDIAPKVNSDETTAMS